MVHLLVVRPLVALSYEACDGRTHYDSTYLDNMDRCSTLVVDLCNSDHSSLEEDSIPPPPLLLYPSLM